jgi:GNAT superfamily N-acetyltransferase
VIRDLFVFVIEHHDDIVAFIALDGAVDQIRPLYAAPEVVRCGVGTVLLESVESTARRLVIPRLSVSATLNAVGVYSRRGDLNKGAAENVLPQGVSLRCVRMEKTLAKQRAAARNGSGAKPPV